MVTVRKHHVPQSKKKVNKGTLNYVSVTIHETANEAAGASAAAHGRLQFNGNPYEGSWHDSIDHIEVVESYPDTDRCWHAGKPVGNNTSYSIEICVNSKENFPEACRNAAWRAAQKLKAKNLGVDKLVQHNSWTGKDCPRHLRKGDWGVTWAEFRGWVKAFLEEDEPAKPTPTPTPAPTPTPTPAPAPSTPAPPINRHVERVQQRLHGLGYYNGFVDNVHGPATTAAIKAYQETQNRWGNAGLAVDGQWGPNTENWYVWVSQAQRALNEFKGFEIKSDGDYGSNTAAKVREVQARNKLYKDGILGPNLQSWMASKGSSLGRRP